MTIEGYVIAALSKTLDSPVSGDKPTPMPERFHTVKKTGSREGDHIYTATLAIQSWAESTAAAAILNDEVKAAMTALIRCPEISRVECETDYNYPDLTTKKPRYQALFEVTYNL